MNDRRQLRRTFYPADLRAFPAEFDLRTGEMTIAPSLRFEMRTLSPMRMPVILTNSESKTGA
jgi:hypothetical protein